MNNSEILDIWKSHEKKLDENLQLNRKNAEDITALKVKSFLSSMTPIKIFTIIAGILWVGFVDVILIAVFNHASIFFLVSIGLQSLLTKLAIGIYLYQVILIHQTDISEPVIKTQERIASLKTSTIWVTRILFLQLPLWTTFYLTMGTIKNGSAAGLAVQAFITLAFTFAAVWLFINIDLRNATKKWFRLIFSGKEWDPVMKSAELLNQVKEYKSSQ